MAIPLLTRCAVFAAKIEGTDGTAEALTAAEGEFNVFNFEMPEETNFIERPGQAVFSPLKGVPGMQSGRATFECEMVGASASGGGGTAWATVLLPACGMTTSSPFTFVSCPTDPSFATIGHFEDGRLRRIAGSQGTATLMFRVGEPARIKYEFLGKYVNPSSVAKIAPDYPTGIAPRFVSATVTFGGSSYPLTQLDIAFNNELILRPDATHSTGIHTAVIVGRRVTVTVDPEAQAYSTKDWNSDWRSGAGIALNVVVGTVAGNTITVSCPNIQVASPPNPGDREGLATDNLTFQAVRNTDAGDDELTLTLS